MATRTGTDEELVPVDEFANRIGSMDVAISLIDRHRVKLDIRWDGSKAIPAGVAGRLLREHEEEQARWTRLHAEYAGFLKQREAERGAAVQAARAKAREAAVADERAYQEKLSLFGTDVVPREAPGAHGELQAQPRPARTRRGVAHGAATAEPTRWPRLHELALRTHRPAPVHRCTRASVDVVAGTAS